jgi:uncharacterized protein (DUF305 family)
MKKTVALIGLLLATLLLAACGNDGTGTDDGATSPAGEEFNDADVTFAQGMIPHHEQAVEMAQMATEQAAGVEVKSLAEEIEAAQGPEIEQLKEWLQAWGEDTPSESMGHDDMGHGDESSSMAGMMTEEDMAMLSEVSGAEFDRMWLQMMIQHHEGAVQMAETEVTDGEHAGAVEMANRIIETQEAEISQMEKLLNR